MAARTSHATAFILLGALALLAAWPTTVAVAQDTTPQAFFRFLAQRVDNIRTALTNNTVTAADAAAELDDLLVMAQAGELVFRADFGALGADGATLSAAFTVAQQLVASARPQLTPSGSSAVAVQRLTTAKNALDVVAAALAAGGISGLTSAQQQILASLSVGGAVTISAASLTAPVAPDSIASIFGDRLASTTAPSQRDAQGRLPLVIAGTSVVVGGLPASLLFVSPGQVNVIVPSGLGSGPQEVVVSTDAGRVARGTVNVAAVAPGIFTFSQNGTGEGVVFNGVTNTRGPFAVTTPSNPGDDKRTRLSIYATGLRNAAGLPQSAQVTIGGLSVPVEFAGRQPGFDGLDQINVVVPATLANAGVLNLQVKVGDAASNVVQVAFAEAGALIFRFAPASAAVEAALPAVQATVVVRPESPGEISLEAEGLPAGAELALFIGKNLASVMGDTEPIGRFMVDGSGRAQARLSAGAAKLEIGSVLMLRAGLHGPPVLVTTGEISTKEK